MKWLCLFCWLAISASAQLVSGFLKNGTMSPGGPAPFDPSQVANMVAWARPSTLSGVDNTKITVWPDSSGNGHDWKEKIVGNDPVITNSVINGLPALWFDGLVAHLTNNFGALIAQPITVYVVCALGQSTNNSKIFDGVDAGNRIASSSTTNGNTFSLYAGTTDNAGAATVLNKWYQLSFVFDGASSVIRTNSIVYLLPTTSGTLGANGLTLMAHDVDDTRPCKGYLAEVIVYSARHTATANLTNIEAFLKTKYFPGGYP